MSRLRTISALLVDVPAGHGALLSRALENAGWTVRAVPVQGAEALSVALQRRGWEVVLYGGEGPLAVPSRKALALVRIADPHLPFIAVSPHLRRGNLSAILRGVPDGVPSVPDLSELHNVLTRELEQARMRRRVRARARRSFDGADALVVALDEHGRVEIANGTACRAFGLEERELLGRDWFAVAVPEPERATAREAFTRLLAGEGTELGATPGVGWRWSLSRDTDGTPIGALGWGEPAHYPEAHAPAAAAAPSDREPGGLRV